MKKTAFLPLILFLAAACNTDRYVTENVENLFRPSATSSPVVSGNTVSYSWYGIADAVGYRFQMSLDTDFSQIVFEKDLQIPRIKVEKLKYNTNYYARVKALAYKSDFDSKWNSLEKITTDTRIIPVVLYEVGDDDVSSSSVTLRWDKSRYVTRVVVTGMGTSEFKREIVLGDQDREAGAITVTGLEASSSYQAVIYDDTIELEDERNYNIITFRTVKSIPSDGREGGRLLSLSEDLMEAIEDAADGQTLILPRGYRYSTSTSKPVTINKNLCILSARQGEFELESGAQDARPVIMIQTVSKSAQINLMPFHLTGDLAQVRFEGIDFQSLTTGKICVPFYVDADLKLDYLIVENCSFRNCGAGVLMFDSVSKQAVNNILFRDDIIDNCATNTGFRLFTLCNSSLSIADFDFENCIFCFSKFGLFTNSCQYSISGGVFPGQINISFIRCNTASIFLARNGGTNNSAMFEMQTAENVVIKMDHCLFTRNGYAAGTNFHNLGAASSFTATACLYTSGDFSVNPSGGAVTSGLIPLEGKQASDVFRDYNASDFTITDADVIGAAVGCSRDWSWLPVSE